MHRVSGPTCDEDDHRGGFGHALGVVMAAARWPVRLAAVGSAFIGLVVAGALGGTPAFAAALTLYVGGPGCSDAGSGTASQPYCTIGKAASVTVNRNEASFNAEGFQRNANGVYPAYQGISCNRRAGNIGIWDSAPATTTVDANLVYLTTSATMYVFGSSFTSLAAMKTATGQEQHGLQANPLFANPTAGNLA